MKTRKKVDYLDALTDPLLPQGRYLVLTLMAMVREATVVDHTPPPASNVLDKALKQAERFECVNCQKKIQRAALYCGQYCQQLAVMVRYIRKAVVEDRIWKTDIQEGIGINLLMLSGGGYPTKQRQLTEEQRQAILKRDSYKCQICGTRADQIDHIRGHSDNPSNLRTLCGNCNRGKAFQEARKATPEEKEFINKMYKDMALRIASPFPSRLCDDYEHWNKIQGAMMGARKKKHNELEVEAENDFEDVDGYLQDAMEKDD